MRDAARTLALLGVVALTPSPGAASNETVTPPCQRCPAPAGWHGELQAGMAHVSDSTLAFGDYTGLDSSGTVLDLGADLLYFKGAQRWSLIGEELGLDSRALWLSGGKPGRYRVDLGFQALPRHFSQGTQSVFAGIGSSNLRLPDDWQTASRTQDMPDLNASLRPLAFGLDRQSLDLGLRLTPRADWTTRLRLRRDSRDGLRAQGGSMLTHISVLPRPVSDRTDRIDASASRQFDQGHVQLAYHGSFFRNEVSSLSWDNPFAPIADGGHRGRLALAPDNDLHQLSLAGVWRQATWLHHSAQLAVGRISQNEDFLPATINPALGGSVLPRSDLDGRVQTVNARLRSRIIPPVRGLRLGLEAFFDERDNRSPRAAFQQIPSDLFFGPTRINTPYSFARQGALARLDYRPSADWVTRISAGAGIRQNRRRFQDIERTQNITVWTELMASPRDELNASLRMEYQQRHFDQAYTPDASLQPPENPLQRRFNQAERHRDMARLRLDYLPESRLGIGLALAYLNDDYHRSRIGLTGTRDVDALLDLTFTPNDSLTAHAYVGHQRADADIAGQELAGPAFSPDWLARQQDRFRSAGLGLSWAQLRPRLDLDLNYAYAHARGLIDLRRAAPAQALPPLVTRLHSARLQLDYQLKPRLSLRNDWWIEWFSSDDALSGPLAADAVPTLLATGGQNAGGRVVVIMLSAVYQFDSR